MKVQLKEKHLCLIVAHLKSSALSGYFKLVSQIKDKRTLANPLPDDLVEIETTPNELSNIYIQFGNKPEGMYNLPNEEMKNALLPQLQGKIIAGSADDATAEQITEKQEAEQVIAKIQAQGADYLSQILNLIADGRELLQ